MTRTKRKAMREAVEAVVGGLTLLAAMVATYMMAWLAL